MSLIAVTAFILTWTTVGLLMLPLESKFLGKKFASAGKDANLGKDLIENLPGKGYRLAPDRVTVRMKRDD